MLIPARPGLTNALGCVVADLRHDFVAHREPAARGARRRPRRRDLRARRSRAARRCSRARTSPSSASSRCTAPTCSSRARATSCRWRSTRPPITLDALRAVFAAAYWKRFGVELPEIRPVLVNLHTAVIGRRKAVSLRAIAASTPKATLAEARRTTRPVWFDGGWLDDAGLRARPAARARALRRPGDRRAARLHERHRARHSGSRSTRSAT